MRSALEDATRIVHVYDRWSGSTISASTDRTLPHRAKAQRNRIHRTGIPSLVGYSTIAAAATCCAESSMSQRRASSISKPR